MIECTICSRPTPGFNGKCSRCLDSAKKNTYQERQQTACFVVDFLRRQEDEIEMAFVRWQARQREEFCSHTPSGIEDLVGIVSPTCCTVPHSKHEKCANCGKWIPWHDFPSRKAAVNAASDVPGEQTADPEEAFAAEPYIRRVEPAGQQLDPRFGMLSGKRDRPTMAELEALPPEVRRKIEEQLAPPEPPPQDVIDLMESLKDSLRVAAQETRRRDELAEERVRGYVREDGTPK